MNNSITLATRTQHWQAYYQLTKPKVVALLLLTALVGMVLALPTLPPLQLLFPALVGIGLLSAAAAAYNHILDQRIDAIMTRTHQRPLVQNKVSTPKAIVFATSMALAGMGILLYFVNALTAWLTFASLIGYAVIYTMYLKRATPQNIVIGGAAGAARTLGSVRPYSMSSEDAAFARRAGDLSSKRPTLPMVPLWISAKRCLVFAVVWTSR